jgi:GxxExxY protein
MQENPISKEIVDAAFIIHTKLGPGLLESIYEVLLAYELKKRGLNVTRQIPVVVEYDGIRFEEGYRLDLLVEDKVVV